MRNFVCILLTVLPVSMLIGQDKQAGGADAQPMEQFRFTDKQEEERTILGRVLVEAQDGGVLVEDQAEWLWNITPAQMKERKKLDSTYSPLSDEERISALKDEFGIGFEVTETQHYLVVSNAGPAYSEWSGALLEKFFGGYMKFWADEEAVELTKLDRRLLVVILANKAQFDAFYLRDVGQQTPGSFGYYSIQKNRVVLYDFGSDENLTAQQRQNQTVRDVKKAVKKVPFSVATVVHEAFHQLAFNTGIHTRYADNPLWLLEGLAMYFETPDMGSGSKWTRIGRTNDWRKGAFKAIRSAITVESLEQLTQSDARFQKAETGHAAYAEAWALTTYLMKRKRKEFMAFILANSTNPQGVWEKPDKQVEKRTRVFAETIGAPADFKKTMESYFKRIR